MGLTGWKFIQQWIHEHLPQCEIKPEEVARLSPRHRTCANVDFTQVCRKALPNQVITGDGFAEWMFEYLNHTIGTHASMVVGLMDKSTWVPPEKAATQRHRSAATTTRVDYGECREVEFSSQGINGQPFYLTDVMSCRRIRGGLIDWFVRWLQQQSTRRPDHSRWILDFEWPLGTARSVDVRADGGVEERPVPPLLGEADVAVLPYLFDTCKDWNNVSFQIDTDIIPVSLLYLSSHKRCSIESWVWSPSNFGFHKTCYDLVGLYKGLRDLDGPFRFMSTPRRSKPVCFALMCILMNTDFYTSKRMFSGDFSFHVIFCALQRTWNEWLPLIQWWVSTGVVRSDDLTDEHWQSAHTFWNQHMLNQALLHQGRFQWHFHLLSTYKAEDHSDDKRWLQNWNDVPLQVYEYKQWLKRRGKQFSQLYTAETHDEYHTIHTQLWFNMVYWMHPMWTIQTRP